MNSVISTSRRLAQPKTLALVPVLMLLVACGGGNQGAEQSIPPVEVTTVVATPKDVPISLEYVGQTESSRLVEIRARVDGYLHKKLYEEGDIVRAGQALFQVDTGQLEATVKSAKAAVAQAESRVLNARQTVDRLKPLVAEDAVSRKDYEDAVAADTSSGAALESAQADLTRAQMNLSYATLVSPVTGLAGRSTQAEGSYITPGGPNGMLTTVAQLDPIFVNFNVSENEWLKFGVELKKGTLRFPKDFNFDVQLVLSNSTVSPAKGKLNFSSPSVDPATGTYAIRAGIPNKDYSLRPGQFVRVRVIGAVRPQAILLPQRAVLQGPKGKFVYLVGKDGKAENRPVEVGDWHGDEWFITSGLSTGEKVIVDGAVKVQTGSALKLVDATAETAKPAPAPADKAATTSEKK